MDSNHLITTSLNTYSDSRESEAVIPELIYLLVKQSIPDGSICRIPYGNNIRLPGADGLVESASAFLEFIPQGKSYWEIGVGDPGPKATSDYKKRSLDEKTRLSKAIRAESTFVFVTPRNSWGEQKQTNWINKREGKHHWKSIRILDGVKLADWLREYPAIGRWIFKKLGLSHSIRGFDIPSEHWKIILGWNNRNNDDPPLPAKLFIAGRENACSALERLFQNKSQSQRLLLSAESPDDVAEFVTGYLASLDDEIRSLYQQKCLLIKDEEAWHSFSELKNPHIFVADPCLGLDSDNIDLQTIATRKGHSVVIPICDALLNNNHEIIKLWSPSQSKLEEVFRNANYSPVRGKKLASIGAGRLSVLKRHFHGLDSIPPYASWKTAGSLAQANLIGKWDGSNQADLSQLETLLGKSYGEWIEKIKPDVQRSDTPLFQYKEKWRVLARGEAWDALGSQITDHDLDQFKTMACLVLGENDPKLDLPKEQQLFASIDGKVLTYSSSLRKGLAETLALLGSRPEALSLCRQGKATHIANSVVAQLFNNATWKNWASLEYLLPLLAEAAPDSFLEAVEYSLSNEIEKPFQKIFAQEGSGMGGQNYMCGLLWALETLAWSPDYLLRVVLILGELANIDPGGQWTNRPANSLVDIFLPWHVQTSASIEKRKLAVHLLLRKQPDIGWELLLRLLPNNHGITSGCSKPTWQNYISEDWSDSVSNKEYWEQITIYINFAIELATTNIEKLEVLIERLPDLTRPAFDSILEHLESESISKLDENQKLPLWEALKDLARKHKKYLDAEWSISVEDISKIEATATILAPNAPHLKYQYLFSDRDFDLYDEKENYDKQVEMLDLLRQAAIKEILNIGGKTAILDFSCKVASPNQVGHALGEILSEEQEKDFLPSLLLSNNEVYMILISSYIWSRFRKLNWFWVDDSLEKLSIPEKAEFLRFLPLNYETWNRSEKLLGNNEELYWNKVNINPWFIDADLSVVIKKLIKYDRANAAVRCLWRSIRSSELVFDVELATNALLAVITSTNIEKEFDQNGIVDVITEIQKSPLVNIDDLFKIEWFFLSILDRFSKGSPITLENHLASNASFFCEIISLAFKSKNKNEESYEPTKEQQNLARSAYKLLSNWKIPPGLQPDETFNSDLFSVWLEETKKLSKETGHFDIALDQVGSVLPHVPKDEDGLWLNHIVAEALDANDAKKMRDGFTTKLFNQRGVFGATGGRDELRLARHYYEKAEALENRGYIQFSIAMKNFAKGYENQAEREATHDPYSE